MKLELVLWPDPVLAQRTNSVPEVDDEIRDIVAQMRGIMFTHRGVGLAAPQVGVTHQIMIVCPTGEPGDETVAINPEILKSAGLDRADEGCLSLPGIYVPVPRATSVSVRFLDVNGRTREEELEGFPARVFQHEFDHLQGTMILERTEDDLSKENARRVQALHDDFNENLPASGTA